MRYLVEGKEIASVCLYGSYLKCTQFLHLKYAISSSSSSRLLGYRFLRNQTRDGSSIFYVVTIHYSELLLIEEIVNFGIRFSSINGTVI
jgi:hypothetical protein